MTNPKKQRSRRLGLVIALGCLAAAAVLVWIFGRDALDMWKNSQTEEQTRALYTAATTVSSAPSPASKTETKDMPVESKPTASAAPATPTPPTATPTQEPTPEVTYAPDLPPVPTPPPVQADFLELYNQNNHLIGWLQAGDNIDHPVVWEAGENDFYLHHDFFGKSDHNGTLFLNGNNRFFPADDVWLIHGHNMRGGGMFGKLGEFRKKAYLYEHPLVSFRTIYDAEPVYYVPIAGFDASMSRNAKDYFDITQIAFPNDEETAVGGNASPAAAETEMPETAKPSPTATSAQTNSTVRQSAAFQKYLNSLRRWSLWKSPADANVDDHLLMLVTCSYTQDDGRFMLVCRKLREGETPESIQALFAPEEDTRH